MTIKAIVLIIKSKRDVSGNTYWAFRITSTETGRSVEGMADHESNVLVAANIAFGPTGYYWTSKELPKRLFKQECGSWKYGGCKASEMSEFIVNGLAGPRVTIER